jgi:hypothetical protein
MKLNSSQAKLNMPLNFSTILKYNKYFQKCAMIKKYPIGVEISNILQLKVFSDIC